MKYFSLILFITISFYCNAQNGTLYNEPSYDGKFYIVISDNNGYEELKNNIAYYSDNEPDKSFLLFKSEDLAFDDVKAEINQVLNTKSVSIRYIYLVISGDTSFLKRNIALKSKLFASTLYLHPYNNDPKFDGITSEKRPKNKKEFIELIELLKTYTWGKTVTEVRKSSAVDLNLGVQGISIGLNLGSFSSLKNNYNTYVPNGFLIYGFHIIKPLLPKLQAKVETNFGIKIPNPESEVQGQIKSQVDMDIIIAGGSIEQDFIINAKIKGHIYYNMSLSFQYFPLNKKEIAPYIGLGVSYSSLTSFYTELDTTLFMEIDASLMSGGVEFDKNSIKDSNDEDVSSTRYNSLEIPISLGVYFKLSNRVRLSLNSNLEIPFKSSYIYNDGSGYLNHFSFNIGVSVSLKKKHLFYQYIK